ncbi:MAG TPA: hypothetical protein VFH70_01870, partial [Acidimicrobiales bacterium]|nr:hypothetical protein [Acidimicrobiales bacterium]
VVAISTPATWGVSPRPRARALMAAVNSPMGRRLLLVRGTRVAGGMDTAVPGSPSDLAGRITIPVGVIHGERDRYVPVDDAVLIHSRLAGPRRLVVLPDFGHAEAAYSPAFADVVEDVIDGLLDRAATADSGVGA